MTFAIGFGIGFVIGVIAMIVLGFLLTVDIAGRRL